MQTIKIHSKKIGHHHPAFLIAEIGVNHNGNLALAYKLIEKAKLSGVDAVKFQTYKTSSLVSRDSPIAKYQKNFTGFKSQIEMLKKYELSDKEFYKISTYCRKIGIIFISTPFDLESVKLLEKLKVPAYKISSGDLTDLQLIRKTALSGKPLIISTGMSTLADVKLAIATVTQTGNKQIAILHCTSSYPAKAEEINLLAIRTLQQKFRNSIIGYSDHTTDNLASIAAVTLGAKIIEKHFTLDKNLQGPDHKASATPEEFTSLVKSIRTVERMLGKENKEPTPSEKEIMKVARKSIVAARYIPKHSIITMEMLAFKRPGTGIPPTEINQLIGKKTAKDILPDTLISYKMLLKN